MIGAARFRFPAHIWLTVALAASASPMSAAIPYASHTGTRSLWRGQVARRDNYHLLCRGASGAAGYISHSRPHRAVLPGMRFAVLWL